MKYIVLLLVTLSAILPNLNLGTRRKIMEEPQSIQDSFVQSVDVIPTEPESNSIETTQAFEIPEPVSHEELVNVTDYIPTIEVELKYATTDNFTGVKIYDFSETYLRYGTVEKLMKVQEDLQQQGLSLKIWDGFRPVSAQQKLWEVFPDPTYVANPQTGSSSHSRGSAVDVTIVDEYGIELEMPTGFDDFSTLADRDYSDCTASAEKHARLLEDLMLEHGFKPYFGEWWHYSDTTTYEVVTNFLPQQ